MSLHDNNNDLHQSGSYLAMLTSFMALFFNVGMGYAVGVFHVALLDMPDADPKLTVWVGSTFFCMFALAVNGNGFIIGLYSGFIWGLYGPITLEILGTDMMATGFGVVMSACGVGTMTGSPFAGSYLVVVTSFMALFCNVGMVYAAGVFHVALLEALGADPNLTVWVGSTYFCMFALAGPVGSIIINLADCRTCVCLSGVLSLIGMSSNFFIEDIKWMFITYSLTAGLGTALTNTGAIVVLGYHFQDKLSIITGISVCGIALGIFVHPALCQFLIGQYGLQGAFLISGAIVFNTCTFGMLMRPSSFEIEVHKRIRSGRQTTLRMLLAGWNRFTETMMNKSYLFFLLSSFTFGMAISTLYLYLPDYLQHRGITNQVSAFSISFSGIGSIVSRILSGIAAHDEKIGCSLMLTSLNGLMGISSLLIPLFTVSSLTVYVYGFIIGLYSGGIWGLYGPMTVEILQIDMMATGFGVVMSACGVGMMTGPPFAGYIFEASKAYYAVFVFSAVMFFTSTISVLLSSLSWMSANRTMRVTEHNTSDMKDLQEMDRFVPE